MIVWSLFEYRAGTPPVTPYCPCLNRKGRIGLCTTFSYGSRPVIFMRLLRSPFYHSTLACAFNLGPRTDYSIGSWGTCSSRVRWSFHRGQCRSFVWCGRGVRGLTFCLPSVLKIQRTSALAHHSLTSLSQQSSWSSSMKWYCCSWWSRRLYWRACGKDYVTSSYPKFCS